MQCIHNQEDRRLPWKIYYALQTTDKSIIAGMLRTARVFQIELEKNVIVGIGLATKLNPRR